MADKPWKKKNPRKNHSTMSDAQIARARKRAEEAGRRYPNLIDNMAIMKEDKR